MIEEHEANRRYWDATASAWRDLRDGDQSWRRCVVEPALAFDGGTWELVQDFIGDVRGKAVCVLGCGDGLAALALAALGAVVTATDISERQLEVAADRASDLRLTISFERIDAVELANLGEAQFDLACSSNGFFVWISHPPQMFSAVHAILKPGGCYIGYDVHPFQRPWKDKAAPLEMVKPYFDTGPYQIAEATGATYRFHWTVSDLVNALAASGLVLQRILETPARNDCFWRGPSYLPGNDAMLSDWHTNPRTGLPVWLALAGTKPHNNRMQRTGYAGR
jgi:SAM-dependent methyltransferase